MIIGVGNQVGGVDVVNLLKLVLVWGELWIIVVIIWSEYKQYFECDVVLECCFQMVKVDELDDDIVCLMLCGLKFCYVDYYGVYIIDDVVCVVVMLL